MQGAYNTLGNRVQVAYMTNGTPINISTFLDMAIVTALPSISVGGTKQGACTDGEYIYQMIIPTFSGIKYNIANGTYSLVELGSSVPYSHANDMAYNPINQHIYVAAMTSDGAVMELDNQWNYIQTHHLVGVSGSTYSVWGLCFDQNTNHFLSENSGGVAVYDQYFNYLDWFALPEHPSATGQGFETDGEYLYRVTYNPNLIDVATITGEYVTTITNPLSSEPETMMYDWHNDRYFINTNTTSDFFYRVILKNE